MCLSKEKSTKITIVQAAAPQGLEISANPVKCEKVVVDILEIEIVTESDVGEGGVSKSDKT